MEIKIIASVMQDRANWELVAPHITHSELTPEGVLVWKNLRQYYDRDLNAKSADFDVISKRVLRHVRNNSTHVDSMTAYLDRIRMVDVSAINIVEEVLEQKRSHVGILLADALLAQDQPLISQHMETLSALNSTLDLDIAADESHTGTNVLELIDNIKPENLIRIAPVSMNDRIDGGALRGHHILLAARPEVGKSLFAIHMTAGFVAQGLRVLYIGNEDPIVSLVMRFVNNLSGMDKFAVVANPEKAQQLADQRGYQNATFVGLSPGSIPELRSLIVKHKPDVLVVDQLRNIEAPKAENRTNQLEAVSRAMRDFARQYNMLVVSVTQAADSASDKLYLQMGDIDGSNTGMPGACDVMMMVGMNKEYYEADQRRITLAKNKLGGNHDSWVVSINKGTSRVIDEADYARAVAAKKTIA